MGTQAESTDRRPGLRLVGILCNELKRRVGSADARLNIYIYGVYRYILYAFEYLKFRINGSHPADGKLSICL